MKTPTSGTEIYRVGKASAGLGLFATTLIRRGTFIIEYTGDRITVDEANRRGGQYLFEVNSKLTIDGTGRQNTARYINHSCRPNAEAAIKRGGRVFISAKKDIPAGTEITYDYGKEFWNEYIKPKGCRCEKCVAKLLVSQKSINRE